MLEISSCLFNIKSVFFLQAIVRGQSESTRGGFNDPLRMVSVARSNSLRESNPLLHSSRKTDQISASTLYELDEEAQPVQILHNGIHSMASDRNSAGNHLQFRHPSAEIGQNGHLNSEVNGRLSVHGNQQKVPANGSIHHYQSGFDDSSYTGSHQNPMRSGQNVPVSESQRIVSSGHNLSGNNTEANRQAVINHTRHYNQSEQRINHSTGLQVSLTRNAVYAFSLH